MGGQIGVGVIKRISGGFGGGIASINGDTTSAQTIIGGTGINVSTSAGTTTITNTGGGGGSGITRSINSVSTNTNAASTALTDYVYLCSGTMTLTLPTAVGNSNLYTVKNVGSGTITVASIAGTLDGAVTLTNSTQYQSDDFISDNTNWNIV